MKAEKFLSLRCFYSHRPWSTTNGSSGVIGDSRRGGGKLPNVDTRDDKERVNRSLSVDGVRSG